MEDRMSGALVPEAPTISLDRSNEGDDTFSITVVSTGGTISKIYDEHSAAMRNDKPMSVRIIQSLRLNGTRVKYRNLLKKDSLEFTDADRESMIRSIQLSASRNDAVVVLHGTDTMAATAEALLAKVPQPRVPIVFTGAMTPYVIEGSDARQNVTEALFACRILEPGVYIVFHGRALRCPGVTKDRELMTFVRRTS
jgi:L-asparaginase